MCETCTEHGKYDTCEGCRTRAGLGAFPFRRDRFTWGALLSHAFGVYKRNFAVLIAATLIAVAAVMLLQGLTFVVAAALAGEPLIMALLQAILVVPQVIVQGMTTLGVLDISVRVARGEPANVSMLLGSWRKLGKFLLQNLLVYAAMFPAMLVFAIPALAVVFLMAESPALAIGIAALTTPLVFFGVVYIGLGLAFASMEIVARDDVGAIEGIKNSWAIVRSQRLAVLLGLILCALACFAGLLACGVGIIFALGFASVLYATVYLTLRNGAEELAR
jgi:hypothetical protein